MHSTKAGKRGCVRGAYSSRHGNREQKPDGYQSSLGAPPHSSHPPTLPTDRANEFFIPADDRRRRRTAAGFVHQASAP